MKKRGKLLYVICAILLCITSVWNGAVFTAYAGYYDDDGGATSSEQWYVYVSGEMPDVVMHEGETREVVLEIKANYPMCISNIFVETVDTPFSVKGTPKVYRENQEGEATSINAGKQYLKFTLYAKKSSETKTYNLSVKFLAGDNVTSVSTYKLMDTIPVTYEKERTSDGKGSLSISNINCMSDMKVGDSTNVTYSLGNIGDGKAYDVVITYDGFGDDGILPANNTTTKKISTFNPDTEKSYTFPIKVSKNAVTGAKKLSIGISYKATKDAAESITETESFYVQVEGKAKETDAPVKAPKLLISHVVQSPAAPKAGKDMTLSFDIKNIGTKNAKNIMLTPGNLSNTTFSMLDDDPYIYIKNLSVGATKTITMHLNVAKDIEKGLNAIEFAATFKDVDGADFTDTFKLYVKNVKAKENEEGDSSGVPKLIIENYSTGSHSVTAGKEFAFSFDVKNTHTKLSANNIKVTITSDEAGTFSVAKGSNSFYISTIKAKNSFHKEIPIKVKADSTTKAYPLKIEFEYEFAGMQKPKDALTSGLTVSETLNIQVAEDSRPALTNVTPGAYGELISGETNSVTFDFTNRGKSPLYNVEVTISGDFKSTQDSYFIGNVEAGSGENHEMEIIPSTEGTGTGVVTVTYEDSNGKQGKIEQEFTGEVMPGMSEGMGDGMGEGMDDGMGDGMEMGTDTAKKAIVSVPVFVILQVVLFILSVVIMRKAVIQKWRKRKMREEEQNL